VKEEVANRNETVKLANVQQLVGGAIDKVTVEGRLGRICKTCREVTRRGFCERM
jgi:hypothetical protein